MYWGGYSDGFKTKMNFMEPADKANQQQYDSYVFKYQPRYKSSTCLYNKEIEVYSLQNNKDGAFFKIYHDRK